ncbi:hypothetical protein BCR34DRAFT_593504, partial [Clohesyomyces aquaticus]
MAAENASSIWIYPRPIPQDFLYSVAHAYYYTSQANPKLGATRQYNEDDILKAAAVRGSQSYNGTFGSEAVGVRVGDVVMPEWNVASSIGEMRVGLHCLVCTKGKESNRDGDGVWGACGNYTSTEISSFYSPSGQQPPRTTFPIPPLSHLFNLPNSTVALCLFQLLNPDNTPTANYTVPFPVLAEPRTPHWRFRLADPTGIPDPGLIGTETGVGPSWTPIPTGGVGGNATEASAGKDSGGMPRGMAVVVFAAVVFWCLRRRKRRVGVAKEVETRDVGEDGGNTRDGVCGAGDSDGGVEMDMDGGAGMELARLEVVRERERQDQEGRRESVETAPPAYHEIVAGG